MARSLFGGSDDDWVSKKVGNFIAPQANVAVTFWSAKSGGTQYTDLLDEALSATSSVTTDTDGLIPQFSGPDGVTELWADAGGKRVKMQTRDNPPDGSIAARINDPASATRAALTSSFVAYAPAPSGGDDTPVLQPIIDTLAAGNGGIVMLRRGTYLLGSELYVKNKVTLRGQGRSATVVQAMGTFPTNSFAIKLGDTTGFAFGSRLSNLSLDVNNITGSKGVFADHGQEMTGLSYVTISNFKLYGVHFATGTDNYDVDNLELYPSATGATAGFYGQSNQGANNIRRLTVGVSGALTTGAWLQGGSVTVTSVHAENCTDGVLMDGANGSVTGVTGPTSLTNVTNLVRMTSSSRYVVVQAVTKNGATNAVKDDFFSKTITDTYVQQAVLGDAYIARLNHHGDKLGFFNTAQVSKASATTDIKTALASYGLLTAGSATPLNLEGGGLTAASSTFTGTLTAAIANFSGLATFNAGATVPNGQALNLHSDASIQRDTGGAIRAMCAAPFETRLTVAGGRIANFNANPGSGAQSPSIGLQSNGSDGPVLGADGGFLVTYLNNALSTGTKLALRVRGTEAFAVGNGNTIGFYGTTPAAKPTISGSRSANAALADLLTKLAALGLITDSTTV